MNSLEDLVRAAVRATASEIGPGDVPPMRLDGTGRAGLGGLRRHRRRGGARRGAWYWGAPLAAAAAVVAVIAGAGLLGGVASSPVAKPTAKPATSARAHHAAVTPSAYPPNLVAGLTGFYLPASGAQFTAGALLTGEFRVLEAKVDNLCMVKLGFAATPVGTPAEVARGFWDLSQFPDLNAIAKAGTMPGDGLPGVASPGPETKAYQAADRHCSAVGDALFRPMETAGQSLGNGFTLIVLNIQSSAPVLATLPAVRSCAARYGWPDNPYGPDQAINSFADFVDWVAGHLDGAGSRGASATQMHALDQQWAPIFAQCARPAVTVMERLQLAAQQKYLRQHRGQFAALVAVARTDFAAAERQARG